MERWFWIDIHYATIGIAFRDKICFIAPPIAKWMIGKSSDEIRPFLKQKKARIIELK